MPTDCFLYRKTFYPSTATNSFSYNAFGARVSKTDSSGTSNYARNGVGVTSPVLSDGSLTFTPGISSYDGSDSTWSHGDIKNSLRQTGETESTTATTTYDAFGNPVSSTGTWQGPFQYGGPFGYQTDSDSGLKLLGHRYYDSSTGRFLTRDPIKDGRNWFAYVRSSPLAHSDASGLLEPVLTAILIVGIASICGAVLFRSRDAGETWPTSTSNALSTASNLVPGGELVGVAAAGPDMARILARMKLHRFAMLDPETDDLPLGTLPAWADPTDVYRDAESRQALRREHYAGSGMIYDSVPQVASLQRPLDDMAPRTVPRPPLSGVPNTPRVRQKQPGSGGPIFLHGMPSY